MAMRPTTPPTGPEVARLVVLGAIARGLTFSFAARTAGISITEVREIAAAAGWPDVAAVKAMHATLRDATSKSGRKRVAPAPRATTAAQKPAPKPEPPTEVEQLAAQVHIPAGLNSTEGAAALGRLLGEYFAEVDEVIDAITPGETEEALATLLPVGQAELEYRGEVVQTGPTPEHLEPLADYVARVAAPIEASLTAELGMPAVRVEFDTRPLLEFEQTAMVRPVVSATVVGPLVSGTPDEIPQPDAVTSATPPSPMPAEYYGRDPSEPSPEDEAELDEEREFLDRHGIDDDPGEAEPLVWDRTELIEEDNELTRVPLRPITQAEEDADTAAWAEDNADLIASEEVDLIPIDQPLAPPPPATDSPAPSVKRIATRPGTVRCEACGAGVLTTYVEANGGVQRHGHCREGS